MIAYKNFTESTGGMTADKSLAKRQEVRDRAESFIRNELNEEDVVSISESAISIRGFYSVTVWYKK